MVESRVDKEMKERASEIFQNIFSDLFLANCGNPVDIEQTKAGFQTVMGKMDKNQIDDLE